MVGNLCFFLDKNPGPGLTVLIEVLTSDMGLTMKLLLLKNARLYDNLETLVFERTRRLDTVATLGEQLNAILNLNELLIEVVNRIKVDFNYYHAHIYSEMAVPIIREDQVVGVLDVQQDKIAGLDEGDANLFRLKLKP